MAGLAGVGWFCAELAPQPAGVADTDDPSVGAALHRSPAAEAFGV